MLLSKSFCHGSRALLHVWSNDFKSWCRKELEHCDGKEDAIASLKKISGALESIISCRKEGHGSYDELDAEKFLGSIGLDDSNTKFAKKHLKMDDFIRTLLNDTSPSEVTSLIVKSVLDSFSYVHGVVEEKSAGGSDVLLLCLELCVGGSE